MGTSQELNKLVMLKYASIMRFFWLSVSIFIFVLTTYYGLIEGFENWMHYYIFSIIAFFAFLIRTFMLKRMKKYLEFISEKKSEQNDTQ